MFTDFIIFKGITFQTNNTTENTLLCLQNNADNVSFDNCVFSAPFHNLALTTVDYDSYALFCVDQATIGTNQNPDNLFINNSSFVGGGLALYLNPYAIGGATMDGLKILSSDFQQTSNICIYANALQDAEIAQNTFNTQKTHNGEVQGIYLSNNSASTTNFLVYENDLFIGNQTGNVVAINIDNAVANGQYTIVKNNTVLATGNNNIVGLKTSDNDSLRIVHNTIRLLGGVSGAAYYEYSSVAASNSLYIENNIFVSNGNPYALICNTNGGIGTPAIKTSNFNDMYTSGGGYLQWDGVNYATLSALQIAQALYNQNSVDVVPIFMSFFDHHLTSPSTKDPSLNGTAYSLYVSVDIDADTRSLTTPKMGADEFALDIALMNLPNLSAFTCDTNSQFYLEADIKNVASEDIEIGDTIIAALEFDGNPPIYDTIIMSTVFSQGDNFIHTFSQSVDVSTPGTYDFLVYVSLFFDMNRLNDTIQQSMEVGPSYLVILPPEVYCKGESVSFGGSPISTTGVYYDSLLTVLGCDSVIELNVTFNDTFRIINVVDICQGDSLFVGGAWQNTAGTYVDSFTTVLGCDSLIQTNLTIIPSSYTVLSDIDICENDSVLIFGSQWISIPGVFYDTLLNMFGCDSVLEQNIFLNPIVRDTLLDITICDNDSVFFAGSWHNTVGLYSDTLISSMNCDSIVFQQIYVNPSFFNMVNMEICDNDSVMINGSWVYTSGIYNDSLTTIQGCDSIIEITLNVVNTFLNVNLIDICNGDSALIHGIWQYVSGIYDDSLISVSGCDSIERVILSVHPSSYTVLTTTSYCANDSILLFGTWINTAGTYYDTLLNLAGCDSILEITVIENPIYQDTSYATICANDSVLFGGIYYNINGIFSDTLLSVSGCDSIQYLDLTVYPTYLVNINQQICIGDSFFFASTWLSTTGIYYDSLLSVSGCDSIIMLNLAVVPNIFYTTTQNICNGDSAFFAGSWRNLAGTYYDTVFSMTSCDTIYEFILNVGYPDTTYLNISLCFNDSMFFNSQWLNTAGTYYDTLTNLYSCDSLIILTLDYYSNSLPYAVVNATICVGDSFLLGTNWIQLAGTYIDTSLTTNLCDSVTELRLDVAIPGIIMIL